MPHRLRAVVAIVAILTAFAATPQAACMSPSPSLRAAAACCRMMTHCPVSDGGWRCCRTVQDGQGRPSVPALSAVLTASADGRTLGTPALRQITAGEPGAFLVPDVRSLRVMTAGEHSPPPRRVATYILFASLLI